MANQTQALEWVAQNLDTLKICKRLDEEIENYEPAELNTSLEQFYAELKNKHGEDYKPENDLKVMIASLDRHLKN